MSELMRQQLSTEVTALSQIVARLQQTTGQLNQILQLEPQDVPLEEEENIARNLKVDFYTLQGNIEDFNASLKDYRDYIKTLGDLDEKKAEEQYLANFPVPNEEIYTEEELQSATWPIFRLLFKAKSMLNRIRTYLATREESSSSASHASRASSPASFFGGTRRTRF